MTPSDHSTRVRSERGFTFLELLICVVILATLAAIVAPMIRELPLEAKATVLTANVVAIQDIVDRRKQLDGVYPAELDEAWFSGDRLPRHPENHFDVPDLQVRPHRERMHPGHKVLKPGAGGAYWYNPTYGVVRVRVTDQGTGWDTMSLYNRVNNCDEPGLGNYGPTDGGLRFRLKRIAWSFGL